MTVVGPVQVADDPEIGNPPECGADQATTTVDEPVMIDVRANDHDLDADGQPSPVELVGPTADAEETAEGDTIVGTADGQVVYTPADGFVASDTFLYSVIDTDGFPCQGSATVEVSEVEPGPGSPPRPGSLPRTGTDSAALWRLGLLLVVVGAFASTASEPQRFVENRERRSWRSRARATSSSMSAR